MRSVGDPHVAVSSANDRAYQHQRLSTPCAFQSMEADRSSSNSVGMPLSQPAVAQILYSISELQPSLEAEDTTSTIEEAILQISKMLQRRLRVNLPKLPSPVVTKVSYL